MIAAATGCRFGEAPDARGTVSQALGAQSTTIGLAESRRTALTEAVARVAPAVVTVQTEAVERAPVDPFEAFFGGASGRRVVPGLGSGFVVSADGLVVTNAHVVAGATRITVALRDGTLYPARVLGVDEMNDLAVLRLDARDLPVATLGNSDELLIGEWAIAIGNPYGLLLGNTEPSVSVGVVSATGRNLVTPGENAGAYVDMIQTDAAVNPGNSGGPLVNAAGEVIGVNSSIYSPTGGSIGLGFAIPVNRARRIAEDLVAHGRVRRPWVGVQLSAPENPREAATAGARVRTVVPGSPADAAGMRPGDMLLRSRERTIRSPFEWEAELRDLRVGDRVPLVIRREDREVPLTIVVADLPEVSAPKVQVLRELELITLTPSLRVEHGIRSGRGAIIYQISERVSGELGIQRGDVIVQINQVAITSADDVVRELNEVSGRNAIRMFVERHGRIYSTDFIIR